jgi:spore maturation protein CgeB
LKKLAILVAENPYGSTKTFADAFSRAANRKGLETSIHQVSGGNFRSVLNAWNKNPPEATLSFSDVKIGEESFGKYSPFPHYSLLVDPAVYFMHHFLTPNSTVTCADRADLQMLEKVGAPKARFLPHAVDGGYQPEKKKERPYRYVFFGSCLDYRDLEQSWQRRFGNQHAILLKEVSRRALFASCSIAEALFEAAVPQQLFIGFHHEVDMYVRGRERVELLKAFPKAHVWGGGPWKKFLKDNPIHSPIPFQETLKIMQQSQFVLNASSRFKEASHERLLYASLSGAIPITAANPYLSQCFKGGEEMVLFQKGGWSRAKELALEAELRFDEIIQKGEAAVRDAHLWEHRIDSLFFVK